MVNTYTNLFVHVVFSVKERRPLLNKELRNELFPYIIGIAKAKNFQIPIINGVDDHVHILMLLKPDLSVSQAVQFIKGGSSKWIHGRFNDLKIFTWQEGYGAFSVSTSQIDRVKKYILNQSIHHQKIDFKQEYRKLLEINNIEFTEKYLF
ncbi:MAG TPA: IS200/IS605 family transposase [Candidatus Magasanikbacteria bacterium]|nr:IS200/IS605 family transposase [Candidatus Magasanikbacteria bacterium]